ncbi:MAG: MopE-related protein [Bradymonadia bacterium]
MRHLQALTLLAVSSVALGCSESREEIAFASVQIDLTPCLGAPEGDGASGVACRGQLESRVADQDVNTCMLTRSAGNTVSYLPLNWSEGRLGAAPGQAPTLPLSPGTAIDVELYFFSAGFDSGLCADGSAFAFGSPCTADNGCLLKLTESGITIVDGETTISFADEEQVCQVAGEALASAEICDAEDNDCDGRIDEAFPEAGTRCAAGTGVCATEGEQACVDGEVICGVEPAAPPVEVEADAALCNGLDDDCDGNVDEEIPDCCELDAVEPCGGSDVGGCAFGMRTCVMDEGVRRWGPCEGEVTPTDDLCDGEDNDCDGAVDEDFLDDPEQPLGGPCEAGVGACRRVGAYECFEGGVRCSAMNGDGFEELCGDGLDNDCDGAVDEDFVDRLGQPCTVGVGACARTGQVVCGALDRTLVECSVAPGEPDVELCDGNDNDCDDSVDEDYAELGQACSSGLGVCESQGTLECNPEGPTLDPDTGMLTPYLCSAEQIQPEGPNEALCDTQDDDCDGAVDEDFDLLTDVSHCGECNFACALDNADEACEVGRCVIGGCLPGFVDLNGLSADGCECNQNAPDAPDLDFVDSNCDGVDGDAEDSVFVSSLDGSDENDGTIDAPVLTLARAVALSVQTGRRNILLDVGTHNVGGISQVVPSGVNLYGGYAYNRQLGPQARWFRSDRRENPAAVTRISGAQVVLRYEDIQTATVLSNLVVASENLPAFDARPSIPVHAVNVGIDFLELHNVEVIAARGANGRDGDLAGAGTNTARAGTPGSDADFGECSGCGQDGGGQADNASCINFFYRGGAGGDGENARNDLSVEPQPGENGRGGPLSGPGGAEPGELGEEGGDGANGTNSLSSQGTGLIFLDNREGGARLVWLSRPSDDGNPGVPGGGGGGGAGGRGTAEGGIGGGGGGGGAGGCPGLGGRGARGGGGSFALMIVGGRVVLNGAVLTAGSGGQGGDGGAGALGAPGAPGGIGGRGCLVGCTDGTQGGTGGRGGCGGHAGGGAGGPSFTVFRVAPVPGEPDTIADSTYVVRDEGELETLLSHPETPAPGGLGGRRPEEDGCGAPAEDGNPGFLGQVGCCIRNAQGRCDATLECP